MFTILIGAALMVVGFIIVWNAYTQPLKEVDEEFKEWFERRNATKDMDDVISENVQ